MKELGATIRQKRKQAGVSQESLAKMIGVTKSTISKYELGQREPSFEQLQNIADALSLGPFALIPGCVQDAFMAGFNRFILTKRYRNAETEEDQEDAIQDAIDLMQYFNELDCFAQQRAVACLRALAGYEPIDDTIPPHAIELAVTAMCQLNDEGQKKAVERVEELTEIPKYRTNKEQESSQEE